jgi:hypothetical protein
VAKPAKPHLKNLDLPTWDDYPEPTIYQGGIDRMIKIFNDLRAENTGAYGSGVCGGISGWDINGRSITSCSPFTATVVGILFDPGGTVGGACNPKYDGGTKDLPRDLYVMHNGNYKGKLPKGVKGVNSSAESLLYFNLAYEIQPKDLRRGDMVGIDWAKGGGHAVFVWDVHLDANKEVDAFCFVSSNGRIEVIYDPNDPPGPKKHLSAEIDPKTKKNRARKVLEKNCYGVGISIGGVGTQGKDYFNNIQNIKTIPAAKRNDKITPKKTIFVDRPEHIQDAMWYAIPGKSKGDMDFTTWKECSEKNPPSVSYGALGRIRCVRFWGFPPPDRDGQGEREIKDFLLAGDVKKYPMPESYVTGTGTAPKPTVEAAPPSSVKGDVEKVKNAPAKKAEQPKKKEHFNKHQLWVEEALGTFFDHKWLETDPGDRGNPNDAESKKAIKEFQEKWKLTPVDGVARPEHRKAMEKAIEALLNGEDPPFKLKPPTVPPTKLERVVWLRNRVEVGQPLYFALHGTVHQIDHLDITFTCRKSKKTKTIPCEVVLDGDNILSQPIGVPDVFDKGSELLASFSGKSKDGVALKYDSKVPLYVGPTIRMMLLE